MRIFLLVTMMLLLAFGTSFARVRDKGFAGTYVNKKNGAVLTVKFMGKNKYTVSLLSNNKECGFNTQAELKNWGSGFNLGLVERNFHAFIESDNIIYIEALLSKKHCKEYVEGDYVKRR